MPEYQYKGRRQHSFTGIRRVSIDGFDFGFARTFNPDMPSGVITLPPCDFDNPDYMAALKRAHAIWSIVIAVYEIEYDLSFGHLSEQRRYDWQPRVINAAMLANDYKFPIPEVITSYLAGMPYKRPVPSHKEERGSFVYLLQYSTGVHKIGRTNRPNLRLTQIRSTNPGIDIQRVCVIRTPDMFKLEKELHEKYRAVRVEGERELFNLTPEDIDYIKGLAS